MAFPTISGNVSLTAGTGTLLKSWPGGHAADDVAFLLVQTSNEAATLSIPAGFVQLGTHQGTGTAAAAGSVRLTIFACRATSGAMADVTVADAGDHVMASILSIRGIPRTLPLADLVTIGATAATSTSVSAPGGTTATDDSLILVCVAHAVDLNTAQFSAFANADLAAVTEQQDTASNVGTGGGIGVATGERHLAGVFGATTATLANTSAQALITIILPSMDAPTSADLTAITPTDGGPLAATADAARFVKITFTLTISDGLPLVFGYCGADPAVHYTIYDGTDFSPLFEPFSTVVDNGGGEYEFEILPLGGWWDAPTVRAGAFVEAA